MIALEKLLPAPVAATVTITSASASWFFAAISPWQENIDWTLRVAASIVAISVGLYTLIDRRRKRRQQKPTD